MLILYGTPFTRIPGKIADGSSGDVATDSYTAGEKTSRSSNLTASRHIGSPSRGSVFIPQGGRDDRVNPEGVAFYRNLAQELLEMV
ncbi:hypothetical protein J3R83DRAFT_10433 [Lanmaoa asiatica]|nr:hypothetical protein J3R83DRAFT_10433 [Lanmaoa asiatica]